LAKVARTEPWSRQVALTEREIDCLTWAARGKTSTEIAQILAATKRNVDFHIETACRKLNVSTRIQAAVKAASGGIIQP
jgi:DNA-binding CsgD family transcriptional regulator